MFIVNILLIYCICKILQKIKFYYSYFFQKAKKSLPQKIIIAQGLLITLFFYCITSFCCDFKWDALFPDGFLDEDVDGRRHAHADGVAEFLKVFFQIRIDADTNRCLCHDTRSSSH